MEDSAQPKQEANSGPGNKKVAAKATKKSRTPSPAPSAAPPQAKPAKATKRPSAASLLFGTSTPVEDFNTDSDTQPPPRAEAKSMQSLMRGDSQRGGGQGAKSESVVAGGGGDSGGGGGGGTSDSSTGGEQQPKVPAWKLALKSAAAGRAAGAAAVADVMTSGDGGASNGSDSAPQAKQTTVPAWKLRNQAASKQTSQPQPPPPQQEQQRALDAATPPSDSFGEQDLSSGPATYRHDDDDGAAPKTSSITPPTMDEPRTYSGNTLDGSGAGGGGSYASSSGGGSRSGSASPFFGREKPSLRKAARMAQMLNRFNAPSTSQASGSVAEPKVPAWKLANQQSALRKAQQQQQQGGSDGGGGSGGNGSSGDGGASSSQAATPPPPPPAPTPNNLSGTTTPRGGASGLGTNRTNSIDLEQSSRPGTDMSGAYTSEDEDEETEDGYGRHGRLRGRSGSRSRQTDSDYESGGMTDIPSGAEGSELSDDADSQQGDFAGRPSSAPPTLFGVNMKKALSRPADRVHKAERKAERLEQGTWSSGGDEAQQQQQQQRAGNALSRDSVATMLTSSAYYSESELSVVSTGMSESESDAHGGGGYVSMRSQQQQRQQQQQLQGGVGGGGYPRQRPEKTSKQLSTLERIMGRSNPATTSDSSDANNGPPRYSSDPQQLYYQQQQQQLGGGCGDGVGSGDGQGVMSSAAEHRASAARGRDLITQLLSKANPSSGATAAGADGGVPLSNADRREALGLDPNQKLEVSAMPDPTPRGYQLAYQAKLQHQLQGQEDEEARARAAFKEALQGGGGGRGVESSSAPPFASAAAPAAVNDDDAAGALASSSAQAPTAGPAAAAAAATVPRGSGGGARHVVAGVMAVRRDVDRLATQRAAAGLKPEKHGAVEVVLLKGPRFQRMRQGRTGNPSPKEPKEEDGPSEKRFLSVSNGAVFLATYFTLLDTDGFVDTRRTNRNGTSEKLCDLLKCTIEVLPSPLSLCGYAIKICKATESNKEGILLRPTRMTEFLEWASTIQQVVDAANVEQQLTQGGGSGVISAGIAAKPKQQPLFRMPGDTHSLDQGTPSSRYAATKRDLWELEQQRRQQTDVASKLEKKATGVDRALLCGSDVSGQMMKSLHSAAHTPFTIAAKEAAAAAKHQPVGVSSSVAGSKKLGINLPPRKVFDVKEDESDPLFEELQRLKSLPLRLPQPPDGSGGSAYTLGADGSTSRDFGVPTVLDATSGSRLAPSPANRAIFHHGFARKSGAAFSAGMSWIEDYRAMQRELDAMEFNTDRSLGYLAEHRHKFYAMAHHNKTTTQGNGGAAPADAEPAALASEEASFSGCGGSRGSAPPAMLVNLDRRQFSRADPAQLTVV